MPPTNVLPELRTVIPTPTPVVSNRAVAVLQSCMAIRATRCGDLLAAAGDQRQVTQQRL